VTVYYCIEEVECIHLRYLSLKPADKNEILRGEWILAGKGSIQSGELLAL